MNYLDFQRAKETFQLESLENERQVLYQARHKFVKKFSPKFIAYMSIDDYVYGKGENTFCYKLERTLANLGSINTRFGYKKFGVWWSKDEGSYKFDPLFGKTYLEAFENVRKALLKLLEDGAAEDYKSISTCTIYSLVLGKILSVYYPEKYLNIFSSRHLNHYLISLDLDTKELMGKHPIYKGKRLLEFKNNDLDLKNWSVDMFAVFLWGHYPKDPRLQAGGAIKSKHKQPVFTTITKPDFIKLQIVSGQHATSQAATGTKSKPDYEALERLNKLLGDRGEHAVELAEINRLMKEQKIPEAEAKKLVYRVSLISDSYGYDIISQNADGSPRYIEVKATQGNPGDMEFFYTANEYAAALEYKEAYYIYVVYDICSTKPKIWPIMNPFIGKNRLELVPIKYKVKINTKY